MHNSQFGSVVIVMYYIFERLLEEAGINAVTVCKATGISQSTISNWKNRCNMLSPANLKKIADYFGVSIDYMMGSSSIRWNPETQDLEIEKEKEIFDSKKFKKEHSYYIDEQSAQLADFLHKNPEYSVLFDASRKVKPEDIAKALKAIGIFIDEE